MKKVQLPEEMVKRICAAANATWDAIAMDCLKEGESMRRGEVIDLVVDHMDIYGDDKEAVEAYRSISSIKVRRNLLKRAFPYEYFSA